MDGRPNRPGRDPARRAADGTEGGAAVGAADGAVRGTPPAAIRPATVDDLDEIMDVQRRAGREATTRLRERTAEAIADDNRHVVVARLDDRCVGWAATQYFAEPDGPAPAGHYLMGVTVEPEHRRKGIARALIAARIAWIRERDDSVSYFANAQNAASLTAHHDWPFEEIARGPAFHGVSFAGGVGVLLTAELGRHPNGDAPRQ
jgi:GNAT superfamily N-acetyltransferase